MSDDLEPLSTERRALLHAAPARLRERAQWDAFNRVLHWINTQEEKFISKGALYDAVMDMRPDNLSTGVDARHLHAADKLAAEVERRMNDLGGYDGRFPVRQALEDYKKERGVE